MFLMIDSNDNTLWHMNILWKSFLVSRKKDLLVNSYVLIYMRRLAVAAFMIYTDCVAHKTKHT